MPPAMMAGRNSKGGATNENGSCGRCMLGSVLRLCV